MPADLNPCPDCIAEWNAGTDTQPHRCTDGDSQPCPDCDCHTVTKPHHIAYPSAWTKF